jgi:hypothetical protein
LAKKLNLSSITATDAETKALYNQYKSNPNIDQSQVPAYADMKSSLVSTVKQQKAQQAIQTYVDQVRSAAKVQILIATSSPQTATPQVAPTAHSSSTAVAASSSAKK